MPLIPLYDLRPRILLTAPLVTWGCVALCVVVFLGQRDIPGLTAGLAFHPGRFLGHPFTESLHLVTYAFAHGSWLHLLGNMLYLWVFGDNVEDALGHGRFAFFYLAGAIGAAGVEAMLGGEPRPLIGASGAVSSVLGGYLLLYPRARILVPLVIVPLLLPAWMLLGLWLALQAWGLLVAQTPGIAWWAHLYGFAQGALLVLILRPRGLTLGRGDKLPRRVQLRRRR